MLTRSGRCFCFTACACQLAAVVFAHGHQLGRRLSVLREHIWGYCSVHIAWGCFLRDGYSCSDRLSEGPADADLEIRLGNLPASSFWTQRHLAWWAAYGSSRAWDPQESYLNAAVYRGVADAYPRFDDLEFNGGNVRISNDGVATLRVRTPSTYLVDPLLAIPHIHLRVCEGSFISFAYDFNHIYLDNGEIRVATNSQTSPIRLEAVVALHHSHEPPAGYSVPEAPYYIESIGDGFVHLSPTVPPTETPTALPTMTPTKLPTAVPTSSPTSMPSPGPTAAPTTVPTAVPTALPSFVPTAFPTALPTTAPAYPPTAPPTATPTGTPTGPPTASPTFSTSASPTFAPTAWPTVAPTASPTEAPTSTGTSTTISTSTTTPDPLAEAMESAVNIIDASVLEFSPIYQCFLDGSFFSHFDDGCADACPAATAVAHGQCVKETVQQVLTSFDATWRLKAYCWGSSPAVLHKIRIAVAGHMDVPFQEVRNLTLHLAKASGRRLVTQQDARTLLLSVSVRTQRYTQEEGRELLEAFLTDVETAASLLKCSVEEVALSSSAGDPSPDGGDWLVVDSGSDPYEPPYEQILPPGGSGRWIGQPGNLRWEVILVIAVGAICLGVGLGVRLSIWYARCAAPETVTGRVLGVLPEAHGPTKPRQT